MKYTTTIDSNGSKWLGEEPDSIDTLCDVLKNYCLDPSFEDYGNFCTCLDSEPQIGAPEGSFRFWGNFLELSHVFSIDTNDPTVINHLTTLIRANQQREDYQAELRAKKQAAQDLRDMEKKQEVVRIETLKAQKAKIERELATI